LLNHIGQNIEHRVAVAAAPSRGVSLWIDPQEELIGIFMIQILPHTGLEYGSEFRVLAYQAIAD